ncbi:MAG: glycosyltransferase [Lewinella sp.]|nr:glycosyltransferase [Lewinella sp.]
MDKLVAAAQTAGAKVELFPHVEDVRPYLAANHFLVLPSYREGLSRAGIEALACGRPVLVTAVPGCQELLSPLAWNGLAVAPRSAQSLLAALLSLAALPPIQLQQGAAASRAWAEQQFGAPATTAAFLAVVAAYLNKPTRS